MSLDWSFLVLEFKWILSGALGVAIIGGVYLIIKRLSKEEEVDFPFIKKKYKNENQNN